jgi:endonuclease/exonuclease/phosphatase family metal-dependent hydrolase
MSATPVPITVCTFNLRFATAPDGPNAWPRRKPLLLDCLAQIDPDILATQEAMPEQLAAIGARFPAWTAVGEGRFAGLRSRRPTEPAPGEHCAIFFRHDRFRLIETATRWLSTTPDRPGSLGPGTDLPRIVTEAHLAPADGGPPLAVYNTHFHWGSEFAAWAIPCLGAWIGATPEHRAVLVTGDFNLDAASPEHAALAAMPLRGGRRLRDVFDGRPGRQGTRHDFTGTAPVCIDWLLASSELRVDAAWTETWSRQGRYPSDHFPVVARLSPR